MKHAVLCLLYHTVTSNLSCSQWHSQSKGQATYTTTSHSEPPYGTSGHYRIQMEHQLTTEAHSERYTQDIQVCITWDLTSCLHEANVALVQSCKSQPAGMLKWETLNTNHIPQTWAMVTWHYSWEWRHLQQKQFHYRQNCQFSWNAWPWRWRHYMRHWIQLTHWLSITYSETWIISNNIVRTSNLTVGIPLKAGNKTNLMASIAFHQRKNTLNTRVGAIPNASNSSWMPTTHSQITYTATKFSPSLVYVYQPSCLSDQFYLTLNLTTATNQKASYNTSPHNQLQQTYWV